MWDVIAIRQAVDAGSDVRRAAGRAEAAAVFVQRLADIAVAIARASDVSAERRDGWLGALLVEATDLQSIARAVIRTRRPKPLASQRPAYIAQLGAEFTGVFREVMARYAGHRISVLRAADGSGGTVLVTLEVVDREGARHTVLLRVYQRGERLRVVDVIWQGVSMVSSHGAKFDVSYRKTRRRADRPNLPQKT